MLPSARNGSQYKSISGEFTIRILKEFLSANIVNNYRLDKEMSSNCREL